MTEATSKLDFQGPKPTGQKLGDAPTIWKQVQEIFTVTNGAASPMLELDGVMKGASNLLPAICAQFKKVPTSAMEIERVAALAAGKKDRDPPLGKFRDLLEGFIMATSGLAVQIKPSFNNPKIVDKVVVGFVELWKVPTADDATKPLWDTAMSPFNTNASKEVYRNVAAFRLEDTGPRIRFFQTGFKFTDSFVRDVEALFAEANSDTYLKAGDPDAKGLRVATHSQNKSRMKSKTTTRAPDRESHHLPQYLFAQYFSNKNDTKAFPPDMSDVDLAKFGVVGTKVAGIDFGMLEKSRGSQMLAVLVAAKTHRAGIHVEATSAMGDEDGGSGQAQKVQEWFQTSFPPDMKGPPTAAAWNAFSGDGAALVKVGVQKTYSKMLGWMKQKLQGAIGSEEEPYFNKLSKAAGVNETLKGATMWTKVNDQLKTATKLSELNKLDPTEET
jgi:hypothetical protein